MTTLVTVSAAALAVFAVFDAYAAFRLRRRGGVARNCD
jgi:hypothetical protein